MNPDRPCARSCTCPACRVGLEGRCSWCRQSRAASAILLKPHSIIALRLSAVNAAVDEVHLQLELAAAVGSERGPTAEPEFAAVVRDVGTGVRSYRRRGVGGRRRWTWGPRLDGNGAGVAVGGAGVSVGGTGVSVITRGCNGGVSVGMGVAVGVAVASAASVATKAAVSVAMTRPRSWE